MPDFVSAQFYMAELDWREKKRAGQERDEIEAKRWRTDLNYEIRTVDCFSYYSGGHCCRRSDFVGGSPPVEIIGKGIGRAPEHATSAFASGGELGRDGRDLDGAPRTSKQMNEAVQKELAFSYEVSLNVKFDITNDQIIITNEGRTRVSLWEVRLERAGE
jgi:hypothetical protein